MFISHSLTQSLGSSKHSSVQLHSVLGFIKTFICTITLSPWVHQQSSGQQFTLSPWVHQNIYYQLYYSQSLGSLKHLLLVIVSPWVHQNIHQYSELCSPWVLENIHQQNIHHSYSYTQPLGSFILIYPSRLTRHKIKFLGFIKTKVIHQYKYTQSLCSSKHSSVQLHSVLGFIKTFICTVTLCQNTRHAFKF